MNGSSTLTVDGTDFQGDQEYFGKEDEIFETEAQVTTKPVEIQEATLLFGLGSKARKWLKGRSADVKSKMQIIRTIFDEYLDRVGRAVLVRSIEDNIEDFVDSRIRTPPIIEILAEKLQRQPLTETVDFHEGINKSYTDELEEDGENGIAGMGEGWRRDGGSRGVQGTMSFQVSCRRASEDRQN